MFLDQQTLLKIWLNPGLNYTESTEVKDRHTTPNELPFGWKTEKQRCRRRA